MRIPKEKTLSIIIPNYNSGILLEESLKSIFKHNFSFTFEVLIIDNSSSDNPEIILGKYPSKSICFYSESDSGVYDAMNKGINLANGEWLIFLGAGDELLVDDINQINFSQLSNIKLLYANTLLIIVNEIYDGEFNLLKLMKRNICHQAIFYNHSIFNELGFFETRYKVAADYIFNLKAFLLFSTEIKYIQLIVSKFIGGGLSDTVRDDVFQDNKIKIINNLVLKNFSWINLWCLINYNFYYLRKYIQFKIGKDSN